LNPLITRPQPSRRSRRRFLVAAAGAMAAPLALSQAFPSKPITILVGFAPGGIADSLARMAASLLSERLKQSVVVENRAGAGGTIAAAVVAKAPKDGYTLLLASNGHTVNATLMKNLPYDTVADFSAVGGIAASPLVMVVRADSPYKSVADVMAAAKAKPLAYGSGGAGTLTHLLPELIADSVKGAQLTHVPYRGTGPALVDLMGGRVEFVMDLVQTALPHVQAGKLRALAVSSARRSPQLPGTPTLAEKLIPNLDAQGWYGLLAPAGTPAAVLDMLNSALNAALTDPAVVARITAMGSSPIAGTRESFQLLVHSEVKRWGDVVRAKNITV
jgi:tripartite-type tricarboxylate transporter receptor subunit TctC